MEECIAANADYCPDGSAVDIAPSFSIEGGKVQIWSSDGCDPNGDPINVKFLDTTVNMKFSGCGADQEYEGKLTFSASGATLTLNELSSQLCFRGAEYTLLPIQEFPISLNMPWTARFRREYGDWTFNERSKIQTFLTGTNSDPIYDGGWAVGIQLDAEPTCREPDSSQFCSCLDLGLYNVIDVETLQGYEAKSDGCKGNPIDIDVVCGRSGPDPEGDQPVAGGVTMYFTPYVDTVPVIDDIAYDTTNLPTPPPGKINVIKIRSASTRDEIRYWTCSHLKFATVRDDWRTDPVTGSGSIGSDFTSPDQNINFNWPYNDLYFSRGCPGGDTVNLVPC